LSEAWEWRSITTDSLEFQGFAVFTYTYEGDVTRFKWEASLRNVTGGDAYQWLGQGTIEGTKFAMDARANTGATAVFEGRVLDNGARIEGTGVQQGVPAKGTFSATRRPR
jgi:hypothetical protein